MTAFTCLAEQQKLNLLQMLAAFGFLTVSVIQSSMLSEFVIPLLGVSVLWWRAKERVPVVSLLAVAATLIVLQPVKGFYRTIRWQNEATVGVIDGWSEAFAQAAADSHSAFGQNRQVGTDATLSRLSELSSLAYVVEVVPGAVPYTGGEIYQDLSASLVPIRRLLWPDKPNMTKYALDPVPIALGMTDRDGADQSTTGITLAAQGYLEHGIAGSLGWMALLGATLALVSRYFGTTLAGSLAGAIMLTTWGTSIGAGFYSVFGGIWQSLLTSTLLTWLLWFWGRGHRSLRGGAGALRPLDLRGTTNPGST